MNRFVKSLSELFGYLGRGATAVDGVYWDEHAHEVRKAAYEDFHCAKPGASLKIRSTGYRVLM